MVEVLADALKKRRSPGITLEIAIAVPMIGVLPLSSVAAKSTVVRRTVRSPILSG